LKNIDNNAIINDVRKKVHKLCEEFPIYKDLNYF